ncbi:alpha/beta hydrolase [Bacillus salipaludis]|uniref:Alpha/beta hydrolase n=1 Tax=Bacillus salipaludis TaxID=2547811 RepID=A0A4R5VLH1_9BACI|nr:alpha/beta hydrolase-fold protein [Bacillus salipaludis]MDQ6597813.1 alpha/beta hydrolase-fold protein [Bacillus salipaludis]TDK57338.1 alpha/beta hydrolase [Bacillus salipaludis]
MLEFHSIRINAFKENRKIRVYVPESYQSTRTKYPVLYMHDGQNVFDDREAIGGVSLGLEKYLHDKKLDVIVVAIDQNPKERLNEYCPWVDGAYCEDVLGQPSTTGGKGKQYVEFIVNVLIPFIHNKYRTLKNANAIAGASLGVLISTYAACVYPEAFQHVAGISCAFYRNQEEIENLLFESNLSHIKSFYMDCGDKEARNDHVVSEKFLKSNERVCEIIKNKIFYSQFKVVKNGEHHYKYFIDRVPNLFTFLNRDMN